MDKNVIDTLKTLLEVLPEEVVTERSNVKSEHYYTRRGYQLTNNWKDQTTEFSLNRSL